MTTYERDYLAGFNAACALKSRDDNASVAWLAGYEDGVAFVMDSIG